VQVATGAQISADPLTTDVKSITYGFVSAVQGGIPILSSANGTSFFAYENVTSVPEPPMTFLMLASILGFIGLIKRKNH
jgi:hypothetical protein